jgi:hypothetical protein
MGTFPDTDTKYGGVLAVRRVPREQWRNYQKRVRFSLHFCNKYRHRPVDAKGLQLLTGKPASRGQTAEQRAQAQCAVEYYPIFLSPEVRSLRETPLPRRLR